jgi:hypothetical protein
MRRAYSVHLLHQRINDRPCEVDRVGCVANTNRGFDTELVKCFADTVTV